MGFLSKILGIVPRSEWEGARLNSPKPFWEVTGETDFPSVLRAIEEILPAESILYFEGASPSGELAEFLAEHSIPEQLHLGYGTIWPRPRVVHLPATPELVTRLASLMESRADPELAINFHAYSGQSVLLEWHDACVRVTYTSETGRKTEQVYCLCRNSGILYSAWRDSRAHVLFYSLKILFTHFLYCRSTWAV